MKRTIMKRVMYTAALLAIMGNVVISNGGGVYVGALK